MKAQVASPILTLTFSQLERRCPPNKKTTKLNNGESMTSPGPLSTPVLSLPGVGQLGPVGSLQAQSRGGNTSCQPLAPHSLQLGDTQASGKVQAPVWPSLPASWEVLGISAGL